MRNNSVIEVNESGEIIDHLLMTNEEIETAGSNGRFIITHGWEERRLFLPIFNFEISDWEEGLSPEEVALKEEEIQQNKSHPSKEDMNAIATMELAEMVVGGGE
ncbi:hypothetical protein PD280_21350 [Virgibacillus salarius]|uniref:hypothetical protein n=1 Tax=Virgibacillus salarius TaxID=447199 RepID=UPI00248F6AD5|nr:hypothetical protein [Virgibacillus salarius]WBX80115.1 hypothetical protein PD280_21350 [Virgibacillus salarius]